MLLLLPTTFEIKGIGGDDVVTDAVAVAQQLLCHSAVFVATSQ